jgi:hypothetical protein
MPNFFTVVDQWNVEYTFKTADICYFYKNTNGDYYVRTVYDWRTYPISAAKFTEITGIATDGNPS